MSDRRLHVTLHARPDGEFQVDSYSYDGLDFERLDVKNSQLVSPLANSFDVAVERLQLIPRCFIEPDGSLLWTADDGPSTWQIDGQLNDSSRGLMTVELKIHYVQSARDAIRSATLQLCEEALGQSIDTLLFQLVRPGVFVQSLVF